MKPSVSSIAACIALTACGGGMSSEPVREYASTSPAGPAVVRRDAVPDALLKQVLADAARRVGADASKLEIVSTEKLTWNDGSLGCAQPGNMYTQALVPGYRIWVKHTGALLDYHAAQSGAFVLCPSATPGPSSDTVDR